MFSIISSRWATVDLSFIVRLYTFRTYYFNFKTMSLKKIISHRLVKSEDLNHHGTLFAGRASEWIVEAGFTAVAIPLQADNIVCCKVDGLDFYQPVRLGSVLVLESTIAYVGSTSIMVNVKVILAKNPEIKMCEAFLIFVHVDERTHPYAHNLVVNPETEEEKALYNRAKELMEARKKKK